jgi:hypothetical protein
MTQLINSSDPTLIQNKSILLPPTDLEKKLT